MWLFTKNGHLSLAQHGSDPDCLLVQAQSRVDLDRFVGLLDEIDGQKHEVQATADGDCRFGVVAKKTVSAQAVARLVAEVDYVRFTQSVSFDFGTEPGYLLWMRPNGLQVARVKPE